MAQGGILSLKGAGINDYVTVTKSSITINFTAIGTTQADNVTELKDTMSRIGITLSDLPFTSTFILANSDFSATFSNLNSQAKIVDFARLFRHIALPGTTVNSDYATIIQKAIVAMTTHTDIFALLLTSPITVATNNLVVKFDLTTAFAGYTQAELDTVFNNWVYSRLGINISTHAMYSSILNVGVSFDITFIIDSEDDAKLAFKILEIVNNPTSVTDGAGIYGPYDVYAMAKTIAGALLV